MCCLFTRGIFHSARPRHPNSQDRPCVHSSFMCVCFMMTTNERFTSKRQNFKNQYPYKEKIFVPYQIFFFFLNNCKYNTFIKYFLINLFDCDPFSQFIATKKFWLTSHVLSNHVDQNRILFFLENVSSMPSSVKHNHLIFLSYLEIWLPKVMRVGDLQQTVLSLPNYIVKKYGLPFKF